MYLPTGVLIIPAGDGLDAQLADDPSWASHGLYAPWPGERLVYLADGCVVAVCFCREHFLVHAAQVEDALAIGVEA